MRQDNYLGKMSNEKHGICIQEEIEEDKYDLILDKIEYWAWWVFSALAITTIIAQIVIHNS